MVTRPRRQQPVALRTRSVVSRDFEFCPLNSIAPGVDGDRRGNGPDLRNRAVDPDPRANTASLYRTTHCPCHLACAIGRNQIWRVVVETENEETGSK